MTATGALGEALAVILATATCIEYNALRQRIDSANGLVLLMAGVVSAMSLPVGGAIFWHAEGFAQALKVVLLMRVGAGLVFLVSLYALNEYDKSRR